MNAEDKDRYIPPPFGRWVDGRLAYMRRDYYETLRQSNEALEAELQESRFGQKAAEDGRRNCMQGYADLVNVLRRIKDMRPSGDDNWRALAMQLQVIAADALRGSRPDPHSEDKRYQPTPIDELEDTLEEAKHEADYYAEKYAAVEKERDELEGQVQFYEADRDRLQEAVDKARAALLGSQYVGGPTEREAYRTAWDALCAVATEHKGRTAGNRTARAE